MPFLKKKKMFLEGHAKTFLKAIEFILNMSSKEKKIRGLTYYMEVILLEHNSIIDSLFDIGTILLLWFLLKRIIRLLASPFLGMEIRLF